MSTERPNISLIRKYLNGELDARAMHDLERQALDDPFLADALEGYAQTGKEQQPNLDDLQRRMQQRTQPQKKRFALWPRLAAAASILVFISIGGWWLIHYRPAANKPALPASDGTAVTVQPAPKSTGQQKVAPDTAANATPPIIARVAPAVGNAIIGTAPQPAAPSAQRYLPPPVAESNKEQISSDAKIPDSTLIASVPKGANALVRIRGIGSIASTQPPLYVVDGKIMEGQPAIASKDIKSINILKDASSTAIYGSRASNGVILITTNHADSAKTLNYGSSLAKRKAVEDEMKAGYLAQSKAKAPAPVQLNEVLAGRTPGVEVDKPSRKKADSLKTITGQVIALNDGKPVPGAIIKAQGALTSTMTDLNGYFKIPAKLQDQLVVNIIGYESQELAVKDASNLKVALKNVSSALNEVVTIGYGTAKKVKQPKEAHPLNGWDAYNNYLKKAAVGINGSVKLSFVVGTDGTLSDIKVLKGTETNTDQKAIDLIQNGPRWSPNVNGKPQTVKITIKFSNR